MLSINIILLNKNLNEFQYHRKEHELSERSPSPLDEAATKIQAAFRGHIVSIYYPYTLL